MYALSLADKVKSNDVSELMAEHFFKERTGPNQVGRESNPTQTNIGTAQSLR